MVKIRLSLHGAKKKPFYKIIVADSRCPRNGKFIEQIGFFNPSITNKIQSTKLDINRMQYWIQNGAQMTKKIKILIKKIIKDKNNS